MTVHFGDALSFREQQVVQLVAEGLSNRQIGQRLTIAEHTARTHVYRIAKKLGVSGRAAVAMYGIPQLPAPRASSPGVSASAVRELLALAQSILDDRPPQQLKGQAARALMAAGCLPKRP